MSGIPEKVNDKGEAKVEDRGGVNMYQLNFCQQRWTPDWQGFINDAAMPAAKNTL